MLLDNVEKWLIPKLLSGSLAVRRDIAFALVPLVRYEKLKHWWRLSDPPRFDPPDSLRMTDKLTDDQKPIALNLLNHLIEFLPFLADKIKQDFPTDASGPTTAEHCRGVLTLETIFALAGALDDKSHLARTAHFFQSLIGHSHPYDQHVRVIFAWHEWLPADVIWPFLVATDFSGRDGGADVCLTQVSAFIKLQEVLPDTGVRNFILTFAFSPTFARLWDWREFLAALTHIISKRRDFVLSVLDENLPVYATARLRSVVALLARASARRP
jgi:hypothetical protein